MSVTLSPEQIGGDTCVTIPNLVKHPLIAKYGIKAFTVTQWRKAKPRKITVFDWSNKKQPVYKTTLRLLLQAIQTNLGIDTTEDQKSI